MQDRVGALETAVDDAVDMTPRRNVSRCVISFFARTLAHYVGRCRATYLHARSLWRCGFILVEGWCGRSPHLNVIAYREMRQSLAAKAARW